LQRILSALVKRRSPEAEIEDWLKHRLTEEQNKLVQQTTQQINDLVVREQHEYGD